MSDVTGISANSLIWSEYYPFGQVRQAGVGAGAPAVNQFSFTGEQLDGFTGLYHLRARQYDPGNGRFLSADPEPARVGDPYLGTYTYVRNNPVQHVDPSGRITLGFCGTYGGTLGLFGVGGALCFVISEGGQAGLIVTGGGGGQVGLGGSGGVVLHVSSGDYLEDLGGPFFDVGASGSLGGGVEGSFFSGAGRCEQPVVGGTLGLQAGAHAEAHALTTVTVVLGYVGGAPPACPGGSTGKQKSKDQK